MENGEKINEYIKQIRKDCSRPCYIQQELIGQSLRLEMVNEEFHKILDQIEKSTIVKRQAPIPIVGSIFRALFGLLSETDMAILENMDQQILNHSSSVAQLLHNTTQILHSEISNITIHSKTLQRELNKLKTEMHRKQYDDTLHLIIHQLQEMITQYKISTVMLNQAISLANLGVLFPGFFDKEKWKNAINYAQLAKINVKFPLDEDNFSLNNIARISNVKIVIKDNKLIYFIEIPLTDFNAMDLFKITPFPTISPLGNESITAYIIPENTYVAISHDKKTYIAPSDEKVHECKHLDNRKICANFPPTLRITNNSRCEIKILGGINYNPQECNIKIKKLRETVFIKLQDNSWIFTNPKTDQISVECNQEADTTTELPPMGLITLRPGCRASTRFAKFKAHQILESTLETKFFTETPMNLSKIFKDTFKESDPEIAEILSDDIIKNKGKFQSSSLQNGKDLQALIEKAKILGEYKLLRNQIPLQSNFFLYLTIIIVLILIIVILLAGLKFFIFRDKKVFDLIKYWKNKQEGKASYSPADTDPWPDANEVRPKPILLIPASQANYATTNLIHNPIHRAKRQIQASNV